MNAHLNVKVAQERRARYSHIDLDNTCPHYPYKYIPCTSMSNGIWCD